MAILNTPAHLHFGIREVTESVVDLLPGKVVLRNPSGTQQKQEGPN
jgi:hypothetical protein